MSPQTLTPLAAAAVLFLGGCSWPTSVWDYAGDRAGDALDVVGAQFGISPSLYVEMCATPFVRIPLGLTPTDGWWTSPWVGLIDGSFQKIVAAPVAGIPLANFQLFLAVTRFVESGELPGPLFDFLHWPKQFPPLVRWLDVSVEVSALLRMRLTVSPGEAVDFVTGFVGLDLAGDD